MKLYFKLAAFVIIAAIFAFGLNMINPQTAKATVVTYAYQTPTTDSTWFSATQSATFTVATVNTYRYNIDANNQLHLMLDLKDATIGGTTTSAFLTVKLPEGRTSHNVVQFPALVALDNGTSATWLPVYGIAGLNNDKLYFRLASGANWSTVSGTLRLDVNTVLEVNDAP